MLTQMVINIGEDPSPIWAKVDAEPNQRYAISVIPNILNALEYRGRFSSKKTAKISSWELLHGISAILDEWCPIPKDI